MYVSIHKFEKINLSMQVMLKLELLSKVCFIWKHY